ncbi:transcription factor IIIA-like [Macrobrachium nipponense]|uniref:transcription factor IIIA-like n=1 Tax=Macrobrachium nipponense TaxID=159736 RepID=UPI0030C7F23C
MDFKDHLALYECLNMQLTSESEMSNDESTLPKASEILDAETVIANTSVNHYNQNVNIRHDVASSSRTNGTKLNSLCDVEFGKIKESVKRKPVKAYEKKSKFLFVEGEHDLEVKDGGDVPADGELENLEAKNHYLLSKVNEERVMNYEASEDCSSDAETVQDALLIAKKRTSSGSPRAVYVCSFEGCGKEFNRPWRLAEHKHLHTGKRPYTCPEEGCSRSYVRKQHLQRHIATSHQKTKPHEFIKCEDCNKLLKNKYNMARHYYRAHVRQSFTCNECGQTFRKQKFLRSHSFTHTGIEPYMCEYPGCGERFMLPSRLRRHALVHVQKCYTCPNESCGETFDVHYDLRKHLATNHPKVCDVCGKKFRHLNQLKVHRKVHDDVREAFFCPASKCDRYFYAERNLTKHIRDKHEGTTIYQCSICSVRLATKQKLAFHMTTHSPSYKRNYYSLKPRRPRKDKGVSRTDYAKLLSGYKGDVLGESPPSAVTGAVHPHGEHEENETGSDDDHVIAGSKEMSKEESGDSEADCKMVTIKNSVKSTLSSLTNLDINCFPLKVIGSEDDMDKLVLSSDDVLESDFS